MFITDYRPMPMPSYIFDCVVAFCDDALSD